MLSFLSEYTIKKRFGIEFLLQLREHIDKYIVYKQSCKIPSLSKITKLPTDSSEHWVADAIYGTHVGAGNSPTDIIVFDNDYRRVAIDVKCLSISTTGRVSRTNNCSLLQSVKLKRTKIGPKSTKLIDYKIMEALNDKQNRIKNIYAVDDIMFVFLLSSSTDVFLMMSELTPIDYNNFWVSKISKKINGIIDDSFGSAQYNKSLSKVELNLLPTNIPKIKLWSSVETPKIIERYIKYMPLEIDWCSITEIPSDNSEETKQITDFESIKFEFNF